MATRLTRKASRASKRDAMPQPRISAPPEALPVATLLSLGEASKLVGVSKSTIWRAIQKGRLSAASRTDEGEFRVEPAELHRVFGETRRSAAKVGDATAAHVAGLEQMLAFAREQLEKAERDRDAWRAQAEAAQKLLIDARAKRFSWWRQEQPISAAVREARGNADCKR